jgi:hypothetical protein
MNILVQVLSLAGAALILVAFFSLQRGWSKSHGRWYLWANLWGALLLTAVAVYDRRMGFIVLEATWAAVSLWGLVRPSPRTGPPAPDFGGRRRP